MSVQRIEILVVGAGLTGLAYAWRRAREGRDVLVLEAAAQPGGTLRAAGRRGVTVEPRAAFLMGPAPHVETLLGTLPSPPRLLGPQPLATWGRGGLEWPRRRPSPLDLATGGPAAWLARARRERRGARARPPLADADPLPEVRVFEGGAASLTAALGEALGPRLRLGRRAVALESRVPGSGVEIRDEHGVTWRAGEVVLAVGPAEQSRLLAGVAPHHAEALDALRMVPDVAVALTLGSPAARAVPDVGGFVAREGAEARVALCVFASRLEPGRAPPRRSRLQAFLDPHRVPQASDWEDATLLRVVTTEVERALGTRIGVVDGQVIRLPEAIPVPQPGHRARLARMHAELEDHGIRLLGDHVLGAGLDRRCVAGSPLPGPLPDGAALA